MKNTLTKTLAAGAACVLAVSTVMAQGVGVSANVGPLNASVGVGVPGTFTAYTPGQDYFMFRGASGDPTRYYYTNDTVVVDPSGARVAWTEVRPDMGATVYHVKENDRMIVKKVVLSKPVTVKKTTTTTTAAEVPVVEEKTTTTTTVTKP